MPTLSLQCQAAKFRTMAQTLMLICRAPACAQTDGTHPASHQSVDAHEPGAAIENYEK